jgi:O-acetyl-ADP-ribose deacetylase (regulator of RNase III)
MKIGKITLEFKQGNITKSRSDAIVNASNPYMKGGGGVDGAIHRAAGKEKLLQATKNEMKKQKIEKVPTGQSIITSSFDLKENGIKYIIHTIGPVYNKYGEKSLDLLKSCIKTSLKLAEKNNVESIAFPLIGTGIYGVPVEIFAKAAKNILTKYEFKTIKKIEIYIYNDPEKEKIIKEIF